jgi:hypothetical protein
VRQSCVAVFVLIAATAAAGPKFLSVWKAPDVSRLNLAGKKVAAIVITDDQSLQQSGEEALTRELAARNVTAVASYRMIPREEIRNRDKARTWFEQAGVAGVVALRPVSRETERTPTVVAWSSWYYQSFWDYYDYGWTSVAVAPSRETTTIVVETLVYDVTQNKLVWAATSETKDPKTLQKFITDLVNAAVGEMKKMKMVG